jgi:hypothetical protein
MRSIFPPLTLASRVVYPNSCEVALIRYTIRAAITPPGRGSGAPPSAITPPGRGRGAPPSAITPPGRGSGAPPSAITPPGRGSGAPPSAITPPGRGKGAPPSAVNFCCDAKAIAHVERPSTNKILVSRMFPPELVCWEVPRTLVIPKLRAGMRLREEPWRSIRPASLVAIPTTTESAQLLIV